MPSCRRRLEKKSSNKIGGRSRWQKRWFALMTKEENGFVDSRSLQYFSSEPTLDQEPEHAIPLPLGRSLEPYDQVKFRLRIPAPAWTRSRLLFANRSATLDPLPLHPSSSW